MSGITGVGGGGGGAGTSSALSSVDVSVATTSELLSDSLREPSALWVLNLVERGTNAEAAPNKAADRTISLTFFIIIYLFSDNLSFFVLLLLSTVLE